jgi:hypothetical protein
MVMSHVTNAWTLESSRHSEPWYTVEFIAGVASALFLFLAGVAVAMAATVKGAAAARRRGWQVFGLAFLFRLQSLILGFGSPDTLLKVDMLNVMGLSMVAASYVWEAGATRQRRIAALALATLVIAMITPIVRRVALLGALPDPIEAYLRPEGFYAAFPFFAWGGFLFAGALTGELIGGVRRERAHALQTGLAIAAGATVMLAWWASFVPSIYEPPSRFWNDSPTFFFIRLGLVMLLVPMAWVFEQLLPARVFSPLVTFGRSSLFVYWIHVEMVYGVAADPIKGALPLAGSLAAAALLSLGLFGLVLLKNRQLAGHEFRGPLRIIAPVLR